MVLTPRPTSLTSTRIGRADVSHAYHDVFNPVDLMGEVSRYERVHEEQLLRGHRAHRCRDYSCVSIFGEVNRGF